MTALDVVLLSRLLALVEFFDRLDLLLLLHAPVLEPDLDLALGEEERVRQFDASTQRQVPVELELLLEFQRLIARVRLASAAALIRIRTCRKKCQK